MDKKFHGKPIRVYNQSKIYDHIKFSQGIFQFHL